MGIAERARGCSRPIAPGIEAASVTIETAPDTGTRLRREVLMNLDNDAPGFAQRMLHEVVDDYPAGSSTVKAFVAITFAALNRAGGKRRTTDGMDRELAARLPGLTGSLQATGAGAARPLSAQELCEAIRVAYDPAAAHILDEAHAEGARLSCCGPTSANRRRRCRGTATGTTRPTRARGR